MNAGFGYPTVDELQSWAAALGQHLDESEARRLRRRLRWSAHLFTKSTLVALLAAVACAALAVPADGRNFWVLYGAAILIPLVAAYAYRPFLAAAAPELTVRYYVLAVLDRLKRWASSGADLEYLRAVIPALESALLGPAMNRNLAGSTVARATLRARIAGVANQLGEAERRLLAGDVRDHVGITTGIRADLGRLLVAVMLRRYPDLPAPADSPGPDASAQSAAEADAGPIRKAIDTLLGRVWEGVGVALVAVLVPTAKSFAERHTTAVTIIVAVAAGLACALMARLLRPGNQTRSLLETAGLGVLGSLAGAAAVAFVRGRAGLDAWTLGAEFLGAIGVITVVGLVVERLRRRQPARPFVGA